jgi:hypothetical protein
MGLQQPLRRIDGDVSGLRILARLVLMSGFD